MNFLKSCSFEGSVNGGEVLGTESCKEAESGVEGSDVNRSEEPPGLAWRDGEVGEDPETARSDGAGELLSEGVEFLLVEAVKKEVGDYEVGSDQIQVRGQTCGGGLQGGEPRAGEGAAFAQQTEHGGAGIYGERMEAGIVTEEGSKKTAVAIAQHESVGGWGEQGEEVLAGAGEQWAEEEVLSPAVEAGYAVEVGSHRERST